MNKRKTDPVEQQSKNPLEERIEQLKQIFPEAVNEDGIDFDTLFNLLAKEERRKERYNFTWAGKQDAILSLQKRSKATLKPVSEESVNWDETKNLFIEGDNLEVMKLLYKSYFGRVKMIYIDPPYNTGNDFIYPDNYSEPLTSYLKITGQIDTNGDAQISNFDTSGRKHSTWLNMMYPRLFLARQLLRDDGVIFISIDENEDANLRHLMNEVFGEENFVSAVSIVSNWKGRSDEKYIAKAHDTLLIYHKGKYETYGLPLPDEYLKEYKYIDGSGRKYRLLGLRKRGSASRRKDRPKMFYPFYIDPETGAVSLEKSQNHSIEVLPVLSSGEEGRWRWGKATSKDRLEELTGKIVQGTKRYDVFQIEYPDIEGEYRRITPKSIWMETEFSNEAGTLAYKELLPEIPFDNPKPPDLMKQCLMMSTGHNDIVLDFFAGSASTAQAVLELNREENENRRFILVQLPEPIDNPDYCNIAEIGKERIRRVINMMMAEEKDMLEGLKKHPDEDLGFRVFKLDKSSMRQWEDLPANDTSTDEYQRQMEMFVKDPLLDGWTKQDVIAEVAIKEAGFSLTYRIEQMEEVTEQNVYVVIDEEKGQSFYICLDDNLSLDALKPLNLTRDDLLIFRDSAIDDTTVANLALTCQIKSI